MNLEELVKKAGQYSKATVAVSVAEDEDVLHAVNEAVNRELASFLLFGNEECVIKKLKQHFPSLLQNNKVEIQHVPTKEHAAKSAVIAVKEGRANILMKGNLPTALLMKAVLHKEIGLRTMNVLSHVAAFEIPKYNRLLLLTDAGMNVEPDLQQKVGIIENAVHIAKRIGISEPLVASLAAIELINPKMQATIDGAVLTQMNKRGQIKDCIIDGPLALDNAISLEASAHKEISGEVAGRANILLVPNIEVGNTLYKSLTYFADAKVGSVIAGATAPIVLTSRSDSAENKLYSLALAICCSSLAE